MVSFSEQILARSDVCSSLGGALLSGGALVVAEMNKSWSLIEFVESSLTKKDGL
jgi:hypothetical protein